MVLSCEISPFLCLYFHLMYVNSNKKADINLRLRLMSAFKKIIYCFSVSLYNPPFLHGKKFFSLIADLAS